MIMALQDSPTALESTFSSLISRRRSRSLLRRLTTVPPGTVDFSSNDYLSLSTNPDIRQAFLNLLRNEGYGSHPGQEEPSTSPPRPPLQLGSRGSRLLDGNHPFADSLECLIAAHHNSPSALLFTSGFDANVGLFSCAPQPGDFIVYDELIHASVHDGMRLSRVPAARRLSFGHNSIVGLRDMLEELISGENGVQEGNANVFVAVEAVYSMDGDLAPLREMVDVVHEMIPRGNGYLIVDEAHATGVFGQRGRGLCCELDVEDKIFARVVTFGKAVGSQGGESCSLLFYPFFIISKFLIIHPAIMSSDRLKCDVYSCRSVLKDRPGISHKLRPDIDIHHGHVIPVTCQHQSLIRLHDIRQDGEFGRAPPASHPPHPSPTLPPRLNPCRGPFSTSNTRRKPPW